MADEYGIFSDDDLDQSGNHGDSIVTSTPMKPTDVNLQPRLTLRKLRNVPKNLSVQRLQDLEGDGRSRSRSPTPSNTNNSNGHGLSSLPITVSVPSSLILPPSNERILENRNGASFQNENSFQQQRNNNGLFALVPNLSPASHGRLLPPRARRDVSFLSTVSGCFLCFTLVLISTLLYTLIDINSSLTEFRLELRETMNNYQMHLINLQSLHRLESKEGKEREKRLFAKTSKIESVLMDLRKAVQSPNYLDGMSSFGQPTDFSPSSQEKKEALLTFLEELRMESPKQTRDTFVQLLNIIGETLNDVETRPACIVFLVPPNIQSKAFPSCFGRKVANGVNRIFSGPTYQVNVKELSLQDLLEAPDITTLHNDLKSYFTYEGGKAVLVQDVEQIQSYEMLMLLHAFCDNTMAYDPTATFIFTLNVPNVIYDEYQWVEHNSFRMTYDTLTAAWESVLTPDKTPALISRIAVASILIRDEDTC